MGEMEDTARSGLINRTGGDGLRFSHEMVGEVGKWKESGTGKYSSEISEVESEFSENQQHKNSGVAGLCGCVGVSHDRNRIASPAQGTGTIDNHHMVGIDECSPIALQTLGFAGTPSLCRPAGAMRVEKACCSKKLPTGGKTSEARADVETGAVAKTAASSYPDNLTGAGGGALAWGTSSAEGATATVGETTTTPSAHDLTRSGGGALAWGTSSAEGATATMGETLTTPPVDDLTGSGGGALAGSASSAECAMATVEKATTTPPPQVSTTKEGEAIQGGVEIVTSSLPRRKSFGDRKAETFRGGRRKESRRRFIGTRFTLNVIGMEPAQPEGLLPVPEVANLSDEEVEQRLAAV